MNAHDTGLRCHDRDATYRKTRGRQTGGLNNGPGPDPTARPRQGLMVTLAFCRWIEQQLNLFIDLGAGEITDAIRTRSCWA